MTVKQQVNVAKDGKKRRAFDTLLMAIKQQVNVAKDGKKARL